MIITQMLPSLKYFLQFRPWKKRIFRKKVHNRMHSKTSQLALVINVVTFVLARAFGTQKQKFLKTFLFFWANQIWARMASPSFLITFNGKLIAKFNFNLAFFVPKNRSSHGLVGPRLAGNWWFCSDKRDEKSCSVPGRFVTRVFGDTGKKVTNRASKSIGQPHPFRVFAQQIYLVFYILKTLGFPQVRGWPKKEGGRAQTLPRLIFDYSFLFDLQRERARFNSTQTYK